MLLVPTLELARVREGINECSVAVHLLWLYFVNRMSTRVLLATLSIPITPERTDIARLLDMDGIIVEKQRRLATLLGLQAPPTRASLINDMVGSGVQMSSF